MGNSTSAANTIIHELIHAVAAVYGLSAIQGAVNQGWVDNDNTGNKAADTKAENANGAVVSNNCVPDH